MDLKKETVRKFFEEDPIKKIDEVIAQGLIALAKKGAKDLAKSHIKMRDKLSHEAILNLTTIHEASIKGQAYLISAATEADYQEVVQELMDAYWGTRMYVPEENGE